MRLPKNFPFMRKRGRSKEAKEFKKARKLLSKLLSLHVVKVVLIILVVAAIAPLILFFIYKPQVQEDITYGVTFSNKYATDIDLDWKEMYIAMLDDLGVKNLRLIAYWDDIEETKDVYNFEDIIWQLDEARARDVQVIMTIGRKVPRYPECFEPQWWKDLDEQEFKEIELLEYIKVATNRLKEYDNIKMWQVENEPFFPFGECHPEIKKKMVSREIDLVKSIDDRPIMVQDSGEGGFWFPSYQQGDYLGISMYRRIWYDFWQLFLGNFIYFEYPLAHWTYKIKADLTLVPPERIIVTELQGEPWGPTINHKLSEREKNKTMSRHHFLDTISYSQKAGFKEYYIWGVEWWYWEKFYNNNPFYYDTAKALFSDELK